MGMNFKPINEVPEITEISEGDKLLVNSGGAARQIDAGRFAAAGSESGGATGVIYFSDYNMTEDEDGNALVESWAYSDETLTTRIPYERGKELLLSVNPLAMTSPDDGVSSYILPMVFSFDDSEASAMIMMNMAGTNLQLVLRFVNADA